ncbi:uncharacterized protein BDZ99DRAFT_476017 [Mytilinidion resinicola]|uniref:Thioesterase/thiol ester dehydrase-isomerase n=1 Tax=Mytilinidion resinicola TaxID=574789 RepID=A0A6A6YS42_9PEZI|nr:uncharacterized protein BDZ99DRAFT_476017 [Mytilinidion resinicola]KAF2811193.1 hypothetical protein BDZ99DRAFT_476017 [Mytilinidion resinicola]
MSHFIRAPPFPRHASTLPQHLRDEMTTRRLPLIYDFLTTDADHKLRRSLQSFLAYDASSIPAADQFNASVYAKALTPHLAAAHHLVYFNPAIPADELLPDGTDPLQSPGEPFVRRMWAGGSLRFRPGGTAVLDGRRWVCHEFVRDVQVKGMEGAEKVFVGIERRMASLNELGVEQQVEVDEDVVRAKLWHASEEEFGSASIIERRNIVFMRERGLEELRVLKEAAGKPGKMLLPQHKPDFEHVLTPTPSLLFRFSALTFNAHAIHLDPSYCRDIEGHRNLLVHGPLTLTLLMELLGNHLRVDPFQVYPSIDSFEYRNLAPLYANEPLRLCGRSLDHNKYELWAETPEGGIACKGVARTTVEKEEGKAKL